MRKIANPYTLILEILVMAFWMPEMAVAMDTAPTMIPTMSQSLGSEGIPVILEIPPATFINACATEPAIPAPMENRVMASMICMTIGL